MTHRDFCYWLSGYLREPIFGLVHYYDIKHQLDKIINEEELKTKKKEQNEKEE